MKRTLYINQTNRPVIKRDGPSIWISEEKKAGRRIPVKLVNRVVITGNVRLDAGTITLFAENNIPITFLNGHNDEAAVVIPYNHKLPDHYKEQKLLLFSEKNIAHYERWAHARRTILQLKLLKKFLPELASKAEQKGIGEGNYQKLLEGLRRVSEDKWMTVNAVVTGILRNLILENLINAGLDPHTGVIHRRHNFGLVFDVCFVIGGEGDIQTLQFFKSTDLKRLFVKKGGRWTVTDEGIKNIVHRFENKRKKIQKEIDYILDDFFDLIREMST